MDLSNSQDYLELRKKVKKFATWFNDQKIEGKRYNDKEKSIMLAKDGFFDYMFPSQYGGKLVKDFDVTALCIIREELGRLCAELDGVFIGQGLGGYPILIFGSEAQKREYLIPTAMGQKIAAFALTESEAGSDVGSVQTSALPAEDGYVINGTKKFISNAGASDYYLVFAKTDPAAGNKGISAFIVDADNPGLTIEPMEVIAPHTIGKLEFNSCKVTEESLVGNLGDGFSIAMSNLDIFRTTVGAMVVGLAQSALDLSVSRAKTRVQFGKPIAKFQAIQFKLADMSTSLRAARLMVYTAAGLKDSGKNPSMESSMAKLFATETAFNVVNSAVQIFGGDGVVKNSPVEKLYREVRSPMIYEGTSEIQRIVIARELLKRSEM